MNTKIKHASIALVLIAGLAVGGYGIWKNPQFLNKAKHYFSKNNTQYRSLEQTIQMQKSIQVQLLNQLNAQQKQLNDLAFKVDNSGFADIKQQVQNLERMNLSIIDSKASTSSMLGAITRLDKLENKLEKVALITDDSAIILSAAMLIKDAADRGQSFIYEAEILSELAKDSTKLSPLAKEISAMSTQKIASNFTLIKEFNQIYNTLLDTQRDEFNHGWKERLENKLNEFVNIQRTDSKAPEFVANQKLLTAKELVNNNELAQALEQIAKIEAPKIKDSKELNDWVIKVNQKEDFYKTISQISAISLARLKINGLKKVRAN